MPRRSVRITPQTMTTAHDFSFAKLDEPGEIKLEEFAGKAVLVVNVASACGFTSQYRDLEALYEAKAAKGLVIVGVPCNDFGHQEPGAEREIREFCDTSYHVTFPMTGKVDIVAADRRHPFYQWIADELGDSALPRWNFHKYVIGKNGELVGSYGSKTAPLAPDMLEAIKGALAA
ncbi:MAG TPA: glutathione peroxidase [Vitreimonas sp.]|nr:glutathione peroxidase [Vitreimonas sp.]